MGIRRERIDIEMEHALYAYLSRGEDSTDPAERAAWEARNQKVLAFKDRHRSKSRNLAPSVLPKVRFISCDMLAEVFELAEINGLGFYDLVGIQVPWPTELLGNIADACSGLSDAMLDKIYETALALAHDWWRTTEVMQKTPSAKIYAFLRQQTMRLRSEDMPLPDWLQRGWEDRHQTTGIDTVHLPEASVLLKVSMHWLLGLPEDTSFYGDRPKIDLIIDAASFMSETAQQIFLDAICTVEGEA